MAITISGDTPNFSAATITALTSTTGTVTTLNAPSGVLATQNGMTGIAKAWVRASSAGVIASSFNVSSVTRNSAGDYTINFTTAMANANYAFNTSVVGAAARYIWNGSISTSALNVVLANPAQTPIDTAFCTIVCSS